MENIPKSRISRQDKQRLIAEALGSGWLLLCGCGTSVLAAGFPVLGVGFWGIAAAWGLGMVTAGYGCGARAAGGFIPTLAVGMYCAGKLSLAQCLRAIAAQQAGSLIAAGMLFLLVDPIASFDVHQGFAGNGYAELSPGGFSWQAVLLTEVVTAAFVVYLTLGTRAAGYHFYPVAAGCLTLVSMLTVTVDNAALSPARSTAVALFAGGDWLRQLWAFWLGPLLGAAAGGALHRRAFRRTTD